MDAKMLGSKITQLRKEKGMTQRQLVELLHVTDGAVSKWERGINFPDLSLLEPIARTLDTNMSCLLSLEASTADQVLKTITDLSIQERAQLVRQLRLRGCFKLVIEALILAAFNVFADYGIYGFAQSITGGMSGFVGVLIGSELYALKNLPKLR